MSNKIYDLLTLDNGNSNPHVGYFIGDKLDKVLPLEKASTAVEFRHTPLMISSVGNLKESLDLSSEVIDCSKIRKENSFLSMKTLYSQSLGIDRLVQSYLCFKGFSFNGATLLIDAGTFITIDLISSEGHLGGYIFPGLRTFLNSYHSQGHQLSTVTFKKKSKGIPLDTDKAIVQATHIYLDSIFEKLLSTLDFNQIVLTGGDALQIKERLGDSPIIHDPHFIHFSMRRVNEELMKN